MRSLLPKRVAKGRTRPRKNEGAGTERKPKKKK